MSLIEVLQVLASAAGAGALATWLISWLRSVAPAPTSPPDSWVARLGYTLLYAPRYTRVVVLVLTLLIGAGAALALGALTHDDPSPLISALGAFIMSQLIHALTDLSGSLPLPAPPSPEPAPTS